jgi:hypothetical protein
MRLIILRAAPIEVVAAIATATFMGDGQTRAMPMQHSPPAPEPQTFSSS